MGSSPTLIITAWLNFLEFCKVNRLPLRRELNSLVISLLSMINVCILTSILLTEL